LLYFACHSHSDENESFLPLHANTLHANTGSDFEKYVATALMGEMAIVPTNGVNSLLQESDSLPLVAQFARNVIDTHFKPTTLVVHLKSAIAVEHLDAVKDSFQEYINALRLQIGSTDNILRTSTNVYESLEVLYGEGKDDRLYSDVIAAIRKMYDDLDRDLQKQIEEAAVKQDHEGRIASLTARRGQLVKEKADFCSRASSHKYREHLRVCVCVCVCSITVYAISCLSCLAGVLANRRKEANKKLHQQLARQPTESEVRAKVSANRHAKKQPSLTSALEEDVPSSRHQTVSHGRISARTNVLLTPPTPFSFSVSHQTHARSIISSDPSLPSVALGKRGREATTLSNEVLFGNVSSCICV
jgi:hypothetical protein